MISCATCGKERKLTGEERRRANILNPCALCGGETYTLQSQQRFKATTDSPSHKFWESPSLGRRIIGVNPIPYPEPGFLREYPMNLDEAFLGKKAPE